MNRETFEAFLERNPQFKPVTGDDMGLVHRKQHNAFIAYVDEQVGNLVTLRQDLDRILAFLVL